MDMTKTELVAVLNSVGINAREGEQHLDDLKIFPKILFLCN